jgi:hypothetical protein
VLKVKKGKKVISIPQEFQTTSRLCIICNDWAILTTKFSALLDRGTVVFFDPDAEEVHRYVGNCSRTIRAERLVRRLIADASYENDESESRYSMIIPTVAVAGNGTTSRRNWA